MAGQQGNQCLKRRMCLQAQPTDKVEEERDDKDEDYADYDDDDDSYDDDDDGYDDDDDVVSSATNRLLVAKMTKMLMNDEDHHHERDDGDEDNVGDCGDDCSQSYYFNIFRQDQDDELIVMIM